MNCRNCDGSWRGQPKICEACRQMRAESDWLWEIDNGHRNVRCPDCRHALPISLWDYQLPYRFCAWCGKKMVREKAEP